MKKTTHNQLVQYVSQLVQSGVAKKQIKEQLLAVGWSENEADAAYSKALIEKGVPIPNKAMQSTFGKKSSTIEIAINLFSFVLLGIIATALVTLFYQIINRYFPDPLMIGYYRNSFQTDAIHYAIAALIIGFPIYYMSMRLWFRGFQKDEGKVETKLTKWLTYLVLLIASITIVGDLIVAVYKLLQGELSARFFLKALTIFVIAGAIFGFYFLERKKIQYRKPISQNVFKIFGAIISAIILIGIILGFMAGGSPTKERKRGLDRQRENDLSSISRCVENYAKQYKRLPNSLSELQKTASYSYCANKKDPSTRKPYEYRVIYGSKTVRAIREGEFELCAVFALKSENETVKYNSNKWSKHSAGRNCDKATVVLEDLNRSILKKSKVQSINGNI